MSDRSRGSDVEALTDILAKHATTRTWLRYDENPKVQEAKTLPDLILPQHDLLHDLFRTQSNFSFVRSTVQAAMLQLFTNSCDRWGLTAADQEDWVFTMVNRFQNLCRAVGQACRKTPLPPWASALPWQTLAELPGAKQSKVIKYLYGFNEEVGMPWRVDSNKPKHPPEFALQVDSSRMATEPIIAVFADGSRFDIVDFDCAKYEEYRRTSRGSRSTAPFEGTHKTTQHKIKVAKRSDRKPLVSMYEQQKQILQVAISWFEGENDEAREQAAIVFMVDLATQYCQALLTKEELKTKRDQGVHDLKLHAKRGPGVLKRPAASILKKPASEAINVEDTEEQDAEEKDAEEKPAEVQATTVKKRPAGKSSVEQPTSKRPAAARPAAAKAAVAQAAGGDGEEEQIEIEDDLLLSSAMPEPELGDIGSALNSLL
jgi:hypothetical protein